MINFEPAFYPEPEPDPTTVCSFCHQQKDKAEIISTAYAHICLECVSLCAEIAADHEKEKRELAVDGMLAIESAMGNTYQPRDLMYRLYDEGYRKESGL